MAYTPRNIAASTYEFGDFNYSTSGAFDGNTTGHDADNGCWHAHDGSSFTTTGVIGQLWTTGKSIVKVRILSADVEANNPTAFKFEVSLNTTNGVGTVIASSSGETLKIAYIK